MKNIVYFDKGIKEEKIMEGLAINRAVITGACNKCRYLSRCENADAEFTFPQDAACMEILRSMIN